ncbi:hypothetical protein T492DRAFT_1075382 [Pavlovales sp. CCMP2436]|nr:hypothetical protein T492DRAFT_1075382 [Pavlovales sp. CCMP2436]
MFECFDNGRGLNKERVDTVMRLGLTGHGNEAEICRGGKSFESLGSLCTGQISAYGIGAKGGAARLCSPDNGVAMEGEFRVRSQVEGATVVVNGRQDFAKMRAEVLEPGGEAVVLSRGEGDAADAGREGHHDRVDVGPSVHAHPGHGRRQILLQQAALRSRCSKGAR